MDSRQPPAEVHIDAQVAERLLASQHPGFLDGRPLLVDEGWDNVTYRIGRAHALRLPRRLAAVQLLLNEQRWLPEIAPRLRLSVPAPVAVGAPDEPFPWPWSVVPWIDGRSAEGSPLEADDADVLAQDLRSLHRPAPADAPANPLRGVPLEDRRGVVEERLERLGLRELAGPWRRAVEAAPAQTAVWLHGDLHPRNVVVREGRIVGIVDWGDLTAGDVATDLACAWMLFGSEARAAFLRAYDPASAEHDRAKGWAVHFGSALLDSGEPRHVAIGRRTIEQLVGRS